MAVRALVDPEIQPYLVIGGLVSISGGIAALVATEAPFLGGMLFGAVFYTVSLLVGSCIGCCFKFCAMEDSTIALVSRIVFAGLAAIASAIAIASYAGFPITFQAAIGLTLITFVVSSFLVTPYAVCFTSINYG